MRMRIKRTVCLVAISAVLLLGVADARPPRRPLLVPSSAFQLEELLKGEMCLPPGRAASQAPPGYLGESTLPAAQEVPVNPWMLRPVPD